jgi:Chain length determinant protein
MLDEETIPTRETTSPVETILSPVGMILQLLLRRVWTIMLVLVVVTGSTFAFSVRQMPTYEATVQMLVSQKNPGGPNLGGDIGGLQDATLTVAEMVPSMPIAQGVVEQLNLPDLSAEGAADRQCHWRGEYEEDWGRDGRCQPHSLQGLE